MYLCGFAMELFAILIYSIRKPINLKELEQGVSINKSLIDQINNSNKSMITSPH